MYSSQNLSVNISHIRGLRALKQLIQVNCSFTSTFNNDYHYELPICALKKKTNCKITTKKQLH